MIEFFEKEPTVKLTNFDGQDWKEVSKPDMKRIISNMSEELNKRYRQVARLFERAEVLERENRTLTEQVIGQQLKIDKLKRELAAINQREKDEPEPEAVEPEMEHQLAHVDPPYVGRVIDPAVAA